jgi:type IV pilus assembly protein PilV
MHGLVKSEISEMKQNSKQRGMLLIEVLVALLLFVIGVLGLVKTMGIAQSAQADAQYRGEAAQLSSTIVRDIWLTSDHTNTTTFAASLDTFSHLSTTAGTSTTAIDACTFSGSAAAAASVTTWVADVQARLPGATNTMQQIVVDRSASGFNRVTVTLCWKSPNDIQPRRHIYSAYVNENF